MEIGRPAFSKFIELIELRTIEVYGRPGDKVLKQLQQKVEMLGGNGSVTSRTIRWGSRDSYRL